MSETTPKTVTEAALALVDGAVHTAFEGWHHSPRDPSAVLSLKNTVDYLYTVTCRLKEKRSDQVVESNRGGDHD